MNSRQNHFGVQPLRHNPLRIQRKRGRHLVPESGCENHFRVHLNHFRVQMIHFRVQQIFSPHLASPYISTAPGFLLVGAKRDNR